MEKIFLKLNKKIYWISLLLEQIIGSTKFQWKEQRNLFFKNKIQTHLSQKNIFKPIETVHVDFLSREFLSQLPSDRPLVIKGLKNKIPAMEVWGWDYLEKNIGEGNQPYVDTYTKDNFHSGVMRGSDILENILSDQPRFSILFSNLKKDTKEMMNDLKLSHWLDEDFFKYKMNKSWQIFVAGKKRNTNLHAELGTSFSLQIKGQKHWYLFPANQTINVNPKINWKMYLESTEYSNLEMHLDDHLGLNGFEVILDEGDLLYFPACFWHFIHNESNSISVSFKWTDIKSFFQHPIISLILLTSRNPFVLFRLPGLKKLSNTYPPVG